LSVFVVFYSLHFANKLGHNYNYHAELSGIM